MNNELYIAGQKIEIDESQVIALTKQIAEIGEVQNRQANLSNTFRTKDVRAMAFISEPGVISKYPYRFLPARLVQNGFEIIRNGNAMIKSAGDQGVQITIYWGNNDFFDRLNFELGEIDFSSLNHVYSRAVAPVMPGTLGDIFYPFINYGGNSTYRFEEADRLYFVQDMSKSYPAIKVKRIWDEIFTKIGFTYSMTPDPVLEQTAMQLTTRLGELIDKAPYLVSSRNNTTGSGTFFRFTHDVITFGTDDYFPRSGIADATAYFINATGFKAKFKIRLNLNMDYVADSDTSSLKIMLKEFKNPESAPNPSQFTVQQTTITESFYKNKIIELDVDMSTTYSATDFSQIKSFQIHFQTTLDGSEINVRPGSTFQVYDLDLPEIEIGDVYKVSRNMPKMTAYNWIQNIARQRGYIFDTKDRHVNIITYADVLKSKTEKRILALTPEIGSITKEFNPGNYSQINNILYTEGVNTISSFGIDNKTLKKQGDLIKIEFYLPEIVTLPEIGSVLDIPIFDSETNKTKDFKIPPLFVMDNTPIDTGDTDSEEIWAAYSDTNLGPISETDIAIRGSLQGITPTDLIEGPYSSLQNILDQFELITIFARMNDQQFFALELYKAYYVPLLRTYVYIQKISNFVANKPVKMTLVKI